MKRISIALFQWFGAVLLISAFCATSAHADNISNSPPAKNSVAIKQPDEPGDYRPTEASEDQLRAAMVVGIVRYTNWLEDYGDTLSICLIGESESFRHIEALENSKKIIKEKTVRVLFLNTISKQNVEKCQVVIAGENAPSQLQLLQKQKPRFLICDQCDGVRKLASVILRKIENRIRFDVNLGNAKNSGVQFRSSMLSIAHRVEGLDG